MQDFGTLLANLRVQRELTQERLAALAGCSGQTIFQIETGRRPKVRPATSRAIYHALASRKPLTESEAAAFFKLAKLDPHVIGDADRPLMLDDLTRVQELARERIVYEPDRPPAAREAVRVMALRPGTHEGIPVSIPPVVLQIVANLIAAHGPERTEQMLRSIGLISQTAMPAPAGSLPPGLVKTPPRVVDGYTVSEVIPAAPKATKASETGKGPAARARRGG